MAYDSRSGSTAIAGVRPTASFAGWYETFFVVPIVLPFILWTAFFVCLRRWKTATAINWAFTLGSPIGFGLWLSVWNSLGGASGALRPDILAVSLGGWVVWCASLHLSEWERYRLAAVAVASLVAFSWLATVTFVEDGTGIVWLALACAAAQSISHGGRVLILTIDAGYLGHEPGIIWLGDVRHR